MQRSAWCRVICYGWPATAWVLVAPALWAQTAPAPAPAPAAPPAVTPAPAAPAPAAPTPAPAPGVAPAPAPAPAPGVAPAPAPAPAPTPAPAVAPAPAPVAQPAPAAAAPPGAYPPPPGAYPPPPPGAYPPPPAPPPEPEDRPIDEHSGFYMQFALGGGYVYIKDEYTGPFIGAERVKGGGTLFSAAFGGGVGGGFVIAGGFESFTGTVDHTDTWTNDGGGFTEQEVDVGGVTGFGMLQKYIGPLYLRALVGGMVGGPDGDEADSYGGLMLGTAVGVDFSVSRRWALGGSFGFRYASGSYSDDDGYSGDFSMTLTSLQFAATFF